MFYPGIPLFLRLIMSLLWADLELVLPLWEEEGSGLYLIIKPGQEDSLIGPNGSLRTDRPLTTADGERELGDYRLVVEREGDFPVHRISLYYGKTPLRRFHFHYGRALIDKLRGHGTEKRRLRFIVVTDGRGNELYRQRVFCGGQLE
ncbi:MAG: hypothetical protein PQJ60_07800 [Spirochaetales bacterium]|nr:hypothetical protein [Spirochaetales bacterium]